MTHKTLTMRLTGAENIITPDCLIEALNDSVRALRDISRSASDSSLPPARWRLERIKMDSPLELTLSEIVPASGPGPVDTVELYLRGIRYLNTSGEWPSAFSEETLRLAKRLAGLLNNGLSKIELWAPDEEVVQPTQHIAAHVDALLKRHIEFGSIEGRLELISVHKQDTVKVWDVRSGAPVECHVSGPQLDEAKECLGRRVVIRGRIQYEVHRPQAILDVIDIRQLHAEEELPRAEDIAPVDLTGDVDPVDYLRGPNDVD